MAKKFLWAIALLLALVCALASCNNADIPNTPDDPNTPSTPDTPDNPAHTHNQSEWETTKAATCTEEGNKERYCSCGEIQKTNIAKTEHNYVDGICSFCGSDKNSGGSQVKTDEMKYEEACSLISSCKYEEAYAILNQITDYAPAQEKLNNFFYAPKLTKEGYKSYVSGAYGGPSWEYDEMKISYDNYGNISSIYIPKNDKTFNYTYDSKGNELEGYDLDNINAFGEHHTCVYKNGKLSKIQYASEYYITSYEYFYNEDGSIDKVVYTSTSTSDGETHSSENDYTYTYYDNGQIKTMRYIELYSGYEYQYDETGVLTKIDIYDSYESPFAEIYGYVNVVYGDYGVEKYECYEIRYDSKREILYSYDSAGRIVEVGMYTEGELERIYLFSEYQLCYSENPSAKERVGVITKSSFTDLI